MSPPQDLLVVLCTTPDLECAQQIARSLVDARLAACVNILPGIRSVYRWNGELQSDSECQLLIKSNRSSFPHIKKAIDRAHPYDVPELLALPIVEGSQPYLSWLSDEVADPG